MSLWSNTVRLTVYRFLHYHSDAAEFRTVTLLGFILRLIQSSITLPLRQNYPHFSLVRYRNNELGQIQVLRKAFGCYDTAVYTISLRWRTVTFRGIHSLLKPFRNTRMVSDTSALKHFLIIDFRFSSGTGHYTQLVWHSTYLVGCGYAYSKKEGVEHYFVCNYAPGGNVAGANLYAKGQACSQCPADRPTCKDSLCE